MSIKDDVQSLSEFGWDGLDDATKSRLKGSLDKAHIQAISDSGWSDVGEDTKAVVRGRFASPPSSQLNEYGISPDAYAESSRASMGSRDRATEMAKRQYEQGVIPSTTQALLPSLYSASNAGEESGDKAKAWLGDVLGLPFRTAGAGLLGVGTGIAKSIQAIKDGTGRGVDPFPSLPGVFLRESSKRMASEMAQPIGLTGSPSSILLAAPYLEAPKLLEWLAGAASVAPKVSSGLSRAAGAATEFKAAKPIVNAMGTGAAYGSALDVGANSLNRLGGTPELPVAVPDAVLNAAMLIPKTRQAVLNASFAGGGQTRPTRNMGEAIASPLAAATVSGLGSGLAEMGLHAVPGVGNMIDQEIKYALKGKRGAGSEMERQLAEIVDAATGKSGFGAFGGLGSIEGVAARSKDAAHRGYDAVGAAIAPKTTAMSRGSIVTDIASPLYGHPIPNPSSFDEYLGWVPPPGKEQDLGSAIATLRGGGATFPGSIPEGSWLDVGKGIPASLNDLYQEARQNMFAKMANGDPAYASVTRSQAERALAEKFRSAHGLQMEPKLFQGQVPTGEQLPTMYWPDMSALRVPANVRQGSSLRANGAAFQNAIRNELGDVVTKYMYGNNAAVDMAGMRSVLNEAAKNYKMGKTGEQLAIQDATKRVGTENPLISILRPAPERVRYAIPMIARYLGKQMQTEAAPVISGSTNGGQNVPLLSGSR